MKPEFTTVYGKAFVDNNVLRFRSPYLPFAQTAFAQIGYELAWIALFVSRFFYEEGPRKYFGLLITGLMVLLRMPGIYEKLLKRSYGNRIRLSAVQSFTVNDEAYGLQTEVRLFLKSGRYKKLWFRKLENQANLF